MTTCACMGPQRGEPLCPCMMRAVRAYDNNHAGAPIPIAPRLDTAWQAANTAPKDGTHILVALGPYSIHWGFNQSPPAVVHYCAGPESPGFYLSNGIVQDSYNDRPFNFTHWRPLGETP